jgi:curli biogenesis system outer membrane secretion channel CsgG
MKRMLSVCIVLISLAISSLLAQEITVGVLAFENPKSAEFPTAGTGAADAVNLYLMTKKKYVLIERSRLDAILKEQSLGATGVINVNQATALGKVSGCKYIIIGNINELRMTKGLERGPRTACVTAGCVLGGFPGMLIALIVPVKGYVVGLSLKVVDVETGAIKYIGTGTGNDDTLERALNKATRKALRKLD